MWIVYKHTNKINKKVYIGQTCQTPEERWRNGEGYKGSPKFYHAIQKYGWDNFEHTIIAHNIPTREDADRIERTWIKFYNSTEKGYNIKPGGSGFTSEKAKECNKKNWEDGTFQKVFCKKVICLNDNKIYNSIKEASEKTGIHKSSISNCCRHITQTAGGNQKGERLRWEFYQEDKTYQYKSPETKNTSKVICLTTNEIFNTITEASKKHNISHTSISNCCRGKQKTAGKLSNGQRLVWRYYQSNGQYLQENKTNGKSTKRVQCIETQKIYNSLKEASQDVGVAPGNIGNCCRGITKTSAGLHWKFYD